MNYVFDTDSQKVVAGPWNSQSVVTFIKLARESGKCIYNWVNASRYQLGKTLVYPRTRAGDVALEADLAQSTHQPKSEPPAMPYMGMPHEMPAWYEKVATWREEEGWPPPDPSKSVIKLENGSEIHCGSSAPAPRGTGAPITFYSAEDGKLMDTLPDEESDPFK